MQINELVQEVNILRSENDALMAWKAAAQPAIADLFHYVNVGIKPSPIAGLKTLWEHCISIGDQISAEFVSAAATKLTTSDGDAAALQIGKLNVGE